MKRYNPAILDIPRERRDRRKAPSAGRLRDVIRSIANARPLGRIASSNDGRAGLTIPTGISGMASNVVSSAI
jgi:hypothetical protein